ncbi:DUF5675 family protein [Shewanella sp.]|jgi:hypothetical protein|uniref:DUF5675 family protein n=1 Tax=Shewanella sp. TaxID=50422 RepID=UPI0035626561
MKHIRIVRVEKSEDGLIGVLTIDGKALCFTLQPDPTDIHFSIPAGNYLCKRFHGAKWKDTFEIIVAGHKDLLFHILNVENESKGCIGLGEQIGELNGKRAILASGVAFSSFMKIMGNDQECNLVIVDCV